MGGFCSSSIEKATWMQFLVLQSGVTFLMRSDLLVVRVPVDTVCGVSIECVVLVVS